MNVIRRDCLTYSAPIYGQIVLPIYTLSRYFQPWLLVVDVQPVSLTAKGTYHYLKCIFRTLNSIWSHYCKVIVTLGSRAEFSETMRELEREVSSLWPPKNCPQDFKKTSAERHFRSKGFIIDWCSFKLVRLTSISFFEVYLYKNLFFFKTQIPQNSSLLVSPTPSPSEPLVPSSTASSMSDYEAKQDVAFIQNLNFLMMKTSGDHQQSTHLLISFFLKKRLIIWILNWN